MKKIEEKILCTVEYKKVKSFHLGIECCPGDDRGRAPEMKFCFDVQGGTFSHDDLED